MAIAEVSKLFFDFWSKFMKSAFMKSKIFVTK